MQPEDPSLDLLAEEAECVEASPPTPTLELNLQGIDDRERFGLGAVEG